MISIEAQQQLLLDVAKQLEHPLTVFAIGGTAMMFHGLKDTTLDIDLVFRNTEDRAIFKNTILKLGYTSMDAFTVYGNKRDRPEMFKRETERFDLFVNDVIHFTFSKSMQERAVVTHEFERKLTVKIADPHDIILMKCATDRVKDKDDARKIIESKPIQWGILIEEAKHQVTLERDRALFDLGDFLEHLKREMKVPVPQEVLDTLFKLVQQQVAQKMKPSKNKK